MKLFECFSRLSPAFGPSGREAGVSAVIEEMVKPYADTVYTDQIGNLIAHKKGTGKRVMLSAHMDSIGLVATFIDEKGFVRFSSVGGLSKGDLISRLVRFENGTRGVISYEEKGDFKDITLNRLYIDIGANSKEAAQKLVQVGDFAVYDAPTYLQNGKIVGPYVDNRIGCVVLIEALKQLKSCTADVYVVFSVQEEVGLRGAITASYHLAPDIGIAVDVTDTGDTPEKEHKMAVDLEKGPAVKLMDSSVICSSQVTSLLFSAAEKAGIAVQREILSFGGTDTGAMQKSRGGVVSGCISVPTRYIHSPVEMAALSDVEGAVSLLLAALEDIK